MKHKVQKILSEIATRKLCTMDEHMAFYNDKAKEDYGLLSEIEEFIKASQEEPVSEDLEKEVRKYAPIYYKDNDISKLARHFANWQKNKMTTFGWKRATEELNIGCIIWDESRHLHLYSDIVTKGQLYISMADILSLPGSPKEKEG